MSNKPTIAALIGLVLSAAVACDSGPSCISPVPTPNACPGNGGPTVGVGADDDYGSGGGFEQPAPSMDAGTKAPGDNTGGVPTGLDAFMGGGGGGGGLDDEDASSYADVAPPGIDTAFTEGNCGASADATGSDTLQGDVSDWGCEPDADAGPSDDAAPEEDVP